MALTRGWGQNSAMTPLDARFFTAGLLQKNADNSMRYGQLWGAVSAVAATGSMTVTISESYWAVGRGLSDGAVILRNSGGDVVTLPAAPASNSRYDLVWVKQDDSTQGDADSLPVFGVTSGTAAASPTVPTGLVPTGALVLAQVLVPSGVTATNASGVAITNVYKFTALSGAPIRYRSTSDLYADAATVVSGATAYIKDGGLWVLRSGLWRRLDATPFAYVAVTTSTPIASSTTLSTLGNVPNSYQSSDTNLFPVRADALVGPISAAGWYSVTVNVNWSSNSTGQRYVEITQNDVSLNPPMSDQKGAVGTTNQVVSGDLYLNAGDFIKIKGWQNSGGSINHQLRYTVKPLNV